MVALSPPIKKKSPRMRMAVAMLLAGGLLLVGAGVWRGVAPPALVKFPLDTNTMLHYRGQLVTFVDPSTGAALAQPSTAPLVVDRHIRAVPSQSSTSVAVVREDLTLRYSGQTVQEHNVYAVDRRSMENLSSHLASSFSPGNPGATPGSYYVTLPMNIQPGDTALRIWKPETATTYPLRTLPASERYSTVDGLRVAWFSGVLRMTSVASYERRALAARGLPMTMSPAQVVAQLTDRGVTVPGLTAALAPVLSPEESARVATVLTQPVPLDYSAYGSGLVAAETRTGTMVELTHMVDGIAVSPDTSGLRTMVDVLQAHSSVPGVAAAVSALQALASAPPQRVYELRYTQTPASVAAVVATARSQLDQITLVEEVIPLLAGAVGLLLIAVALFVLRPRPSAGGAAHVAPGRPADRIGGTVASETPSPRGHAPPETGAA